MCPRLFTTAITLSIPLFLVSSTAGEPPRVNFQKTEKSMRIFVGDKRFADFVWSDPKIKRPYFANVFAHNGMRATRNHPPLNTDIRDHATMHPGIWLAFGDLNGRDYWRNRATVRGGAFVGNLTSEENRGSFTVRNDYLAKDDKAVVCTEQCQYSLVVRPGGWLLLMDSRFTSNRGEFTFGDQEEMGLGVRVPTFAAVQRKLGGRILDAKGRKNGRGIWGKTAVWCDYSGSAKHKYVGLAVFPHPKNFRPCWWHARDYGLLLANPFGRRAFTRGKPSNITIRKGETFRLRFGVLVHAETEPTPKFLNDAYRDYVSLTSAR